MASDYGMDIGTARTIIYDTKNMLLNEASVVAVETRTGMPLSFGDDSLPMIGRTPDRITALCPIERGTIANYDVAEAMIYHFLGRVSSNKMFKARVAVAVPSSITPVQRKSIGDACTAAGARDVRLIEAPLAAAIGLGIDFSTPKGSIIVDFGAGTTDVAVLSLGGLAQFESTPVASIDFNEAIAKHIKKEYNVLIGPHTAENIKLKIGGLAERELELHMCVKGRNQFNGLPQIVEISSSEIHDVLDDVAKQICRAVQNVIENTPPEMVGDIYSEGLILAGGGSLLFGFCNYLQKFLGVEIHHVPEPDTCVAKGVGKAIENFDKIK